MFSCACALAALWEAGIRVVPLHWIISNAGEEHLARIPLHEAWWDTWLGLGSACSAAMHRGQSGLHVAGTKPDVRSYGKEMFWDLQQRYAL